ncbi:NUDIX domain-containing protein [Candidatus Saccharibacteria bacterium]|nr:NUDIX domain-containing protein [Candidatus Saccharibacteria bacterium]
MNHDDELWQEFAVNGASTNQGFPKTAFSNHAKICASAHVWIWRQTIGGDVEILLQLRSLNKISRPGYWDISTAGKINAGETVLDTAEREAMEEIDLPIDREKLHYIFSDYHIGTHKEFRHIFLYKINGDEEFNFNDREVTDLKWFSPSQLKSWLLDKNPKEKIVPHGDPYYSQLFAHVERLATRENS